MNVLFVASEGFPFVKTGGLGDVIGSLPQALKKESQDVRVILPLYKDIPDKFKNKMTTITELTIPLGWRKKYCGLKVLNHEGVIFYFIDNQYYFNRDGLYGFYDEAERYAFFCRGVLECLPHLGFQPQIIHCHDWQTGVLSLFLQAFYKDKTHYDNIRTVFTIHNLAYQGIFPKVVLEDVLGLSDEYFTIEGIEFYGNISYMKAGINYSDVITTVSKTYAEEIKTPFFGENLDGILKAKSDKLYGILNGIDYRKFNPLTDQALFTNYRTSLKKKEENKLKLQKLIGLEVSKKTPLLAVISRLVKQKGLDILAEIIEELLQKDVQLVILGTGEKNYENIFLGLAKKYPGKLVAKITFDENLARRIYAGSDIFLMPSLYEPCGLGQLIALRYGSIPVVRETGGLKDTVVPFSSEGTGNGFTFKEYTGEKLLGAIERALEIYKDNEMWSKLVKNALNGDYSWEKSAKEYTGLYSKLL